MSRAAANTPCRLAVAIVEGRRVVRYHRQRAVSGARGELVVGDLSFVQHAIDARLRAAGIGEVVLEGRADQFVARAAGQRFHLLVDVGDDPARVGRHQRVDVALEERARVEVLIAQPLVELHALVLDLLAGRVVGADEQIADDRLVRIAKRRYRDDGGKPASVLANVRELVDVFDAARGLEHQRLEARRDLRPELDAQRFRTRDHFLRIGDVGRRDLVHDVGGCVSKHAFRADVEDLDDARGVGGDAGEVGAVEDRALERAGLDERRLGSLARRVVGADEQVADDHALRIAEGRHGNDGREPAPVLANERQLIDVLDAAGRLEDEGIEPWCDRPSQLDAQRSGALDDFLWIRDVRRCDRVHHFGGGVAEHPLGAHVEDLNDALGVGGDAREVGAVEDGTLQRAGGQQRVSGPDSAPIRALGREHVILLLEKRGQRRQRLTIGRCMVLFCKDPAVPTFFTSFHAHDGRHNAPRAP